MMARGHQDACLRLTALAALGSGVPAVLMPLMPEPWAMAAMLCLIKVFLGFTPMLIPAAIQMVAPPHLRARMGALFLLSTGLLGTSCGPCSPPYWGPRCFPAPRDCACRCASVPGS
jgi:MFS family permease